MSDLVSEGQVGEDRQVLGPLHGHEEQPRRGLVHVLGAGRVQGHVILGGRSLRLVAGYVDVLVDWNGKRMRLESRLQEGGGSHPTPRPFCCVLSWVCFSFGHFSNFILQY